MKQVSFVLTMFVLLTFAAGGGGGGSGKTWRTAQSIEVDDRGGAGNPQIASDPSGNAVTVRQQADGSDRDNIWANYFRVGL